MDNSFFWSFPETDSFPPLPQLPIPDYRALNRRFLEALKKPENEAFRIDPKTGHPTFGAYLQSGSHEMVTWGILAVGEFLLARDCSWLAPTYTDFFDEELELFLNSPGHRTVEYWYLFYVSTLAGAVQRCLFPEDSQAARMLSQNARRLVRLARELRYDFNGQGYDFAQGEPFTRLDIYRQPDSIAGYAYNMLYASVWESDAALRAEYREEARQAVERYHTFPQNPWYEIPNGSAGLMAAAWLNAHGSPADVRKAAAWLFDHEQGPMQTGFWGGEQVDGLMMGWRGDDRESALNSAYSMESLMPLQFLLPAVRYCPQLAGAAAVYLLQLLSSFQLFYALGTKPLFETKPELDPSVPYERLDHVREGHSPAACGDFFGHRSVYGAGYLCWVEALARPTDSPWIFAFDLSLSDWLATEKYPVYLLRNPEQESRLVTFSLPEIWLKLCPALADHVLWDLEALTPLSGPVELLPGQLRFLAALPKGETPERNGTLVTCGNAELLCLPENANC